MKFSFTKIDVPEIPNRFEEEGGRVYENFKKSLAGVLFTQRAEVFDQQGGASGGWVPLAPSTLARRNKKIKSSKARKNALAAKGMGGVKILQDKGTLRQSFTPDSGPGDAFKVVETDGDQVRIATNVKYAAIHNFGGTIAWPGTSKGFGRGIEIPAHPITIPARPFDEFSDQDLTEINELTENFVNGNIQR